jgi:gamma-glutamyltranspeptidase/glutathione hydrolase
VRWSDGNVSQRVSPRDSRINAPLLRNWIFREQLTALIQSTANNHSIGGGGFMLVRASNGTYTFIDFRETAPAASYTNMYINNTAASIYGGLASGVPGELRGLEHLHKLHGKLPWSRLVLPSANVARKGFAITEDTVRYMNSAVATTGYDFLTDDPTWAIDFAPNGTRKGLGDILTRHRYADTLEAIAERGADAFYSGPIANATINELKRTGGIMTLTDLANYTVAIRPTLSIDYHGFKVTSCQAPSGGPVVLAALNIFGGFADGATVGLNLSTHRLDESMRFAYGMRTQLGDPNAWPNITAYAERMVDDKTADEARAGISDFKAFDVAHYDPAGIQSLETVSGFCCFGARV